jgi:dTDP-4-dehydrorhamnose 3,5-epimerase
MEPKRDDRGWGLHNIFPLRNDGIGQINLSETYPGVIRAYHRHHNQWDYWRVIDGSIEARLYYPPDPYLNGRHEKHYLSDPRDMLEIPPFVWHGFRVLGNKPAKLLYYVTRGYDPENPDEERMPWDEFGPWETEFK